MSEEKKFPMTESGRKELEEELNQLIVERRPEITQRIQEARSFGDLSENSEYQSAKDEQAFVEGRIKQIQNMLDYAEIIATDDVPKDVVALGKTVTFRELPKGDEESYAIVGSVEADPMEGKISNESPMAKALLDNKKGDKIEIPLPNGENIKVEITKISTTK